MGPAWKVASINPYSVQIQPKFNFREGLSTESATLTILNYKGVQPHGNKNFATIGAIVMALKQWWSPTIHL